MKGKRKARSNYGMMLGGWVIDIMVLCKNAPTCAYMYMW